MIKLAAQQAIKNRLSKLHFPIFSYSNDDGTYVSNNLCDWTVLGRVEAQADDGAMVRLGWAVNLGVKPGHPAASHVLHPLSSDCTSPFVLHGDRKGGPRGFSRTPATNVGLRSTSYKRGRFGAIPIGALNGLTLSKRHGLSPTSRRRRRKSGPEAISTLKEIMLDLEVPVEGFGLIAEMAAVD